VDSTEAVSSGIEYAGPPTNMEQAIVPIPNPIKMWKIFLFFTLITQEDERELL
jgi:hypothetical protein